MPKLELTFGRAQRIEPPPLFGWIGGLAGVTKTKDGWWLHLPNGSLWVPRAAMKWSN